MVDMRWIARRQWPMDVTAMMVAGLLLVGAGLRLLNFWVPHLWLDEYATWWTVAGPHWGDVLTRSLSAGTQSPFYYYFVKLSTDLLGFSTVSLRLPSVLFGLGTLALVYPLGRRLFGDRHAAMLGLAVFAVNEPMMWYAQEARAYSLALCCTLWSFYCYLGLRERDTAARRLGYLVATTAAFYAHYVFGFIVVIQMLHLVATGGWSRPASKPWRTLLLELLVLMSPGVLHGLEVLGRSRILAHFRPAGFGDLALVAIQLLEPDQFAVAAMAILLVGVEPLRPRPPQGRYARSLLLCWFAAPIFCYGVLPPLVGVTLLTFTGNKHFSRFILFTVPAALFLKAWLLASARRTRWRMWLPLAAFLAVNVVFFLVPTYSRFRAVTGWPDEGFSQAAAALGQSAQPEDMVLFCPGYTEADLVAYPGLLTPEFDSMLRWPLAAHLPADRAERMRLLPFRVTDKTRRYVEVLLADASARRRVWVAGIGPSLPHVVDALSAAGFQDGLASAYGAVRLVLMTSRAPLPLTDGATSSRIIPR